MWFWEVIWQEVKVVGRNINNEKQIWMQPTWEVEDGPIHSMFALHGSPTSWEANRRLVLKLPRIQMAIAKRGGKLLDAQVVYRSGKYLYDNPDKLLS